jgi:3-oxoacyl-[acyl-carrier-protein] synthase II
MGEAAAVLVLEELEHAQARGAKIYAELLGYGISSDASHMTEPDPTGVSPARAMTMALADAGVDPTEIGYVNAHATSTPLGDSAETRVIKLALGEEHAKTSIAVSSTKGATGHCFGAAGAVEAVFTVLAVVDRKSAADDQLRPIPTRDATSTTSRTSPRDLPDLSVAVSNSFGFGGHNASIVVRAFEE